MKSIKNILLVGTLALVGCRKMRSGFDSSSSISVSSYPSSLPISSSQTPIVDISNSEGISILEALVTPEVTANAEAYISSIHFTSELLVVNDNVSTSYFSNLDVVTDTDLYYHLATNFFGLGEQTESDQETITKDEYLYKDNEQYYIATKLGNDIEKEDIGDIRSSVTIKEYQDDYIASYGSYTEYFLDPEQTYFIVTYQIRGSNLIISGISENTTIVVEYDNRGLLVSNYLKQQISESSYIEQTIDSITYNSSIITSVPDDVKNAAVID
jgi:hypothetical protein